ncbi:hypothetical protein SADFL11_00048920 [Roseibium alexandrii DFL-11]|uniref:Lipoprotein n=1 Tax=Roseibium alexandrii (strain DSM 17067 / NCIMB 14079 / DFL-11) TaxID=244592 RepID=A0A5E8UWG5_ROSAD|nr:hypothetical protein SADFL11_00048920 [Roseibium alexandrii DFL-11]
MRFIAIFAATVFVAGCQTSAELTASFDEAKPAPASVKSAIVDAARDFLYDPYSVRDAEISYMQLNKRSGLHWLCVKANTKNQMGGYTGRQAIEVIVKDGKLVGNLPNSAACRNTQLRWQKFHKLEALRNI